MTKDHKVYILLMVGQKFTKFVQIHKVCRSTPFNFLYSGGEILACMSVTR